jgi:lysozyme
MMSGSIWKGLSAAALMLVSLLAPSITEARNPYPLKSDAEPHDGVLAAKRMPIQGIDISRWQRDIDWDEVRRAGTRFAFIKATEGGDHVDERFRENWAGAKAAGVPRGAYHFVFWCRPAKDQIRWFFRNVPKEADALPPVLDVEWNNHSRCPRTSPDKARAKMREMLHAFELHYGKKPVIYTDINFHEDVLEGTREFDDYPFWIRSTAAKPETRYENRPWEFWQFTTTGRVPGITGDVDRNAFFGTEQQFRDWMSGRYDIGMRRMTKPEPRPEPRVAAPLNSAPLNSAPLPAMPARPIQRTSERAPLGLSPPGSIPDATSSIRR